MPRTDIPTNINRAETVRLNDARAFSPFKRAVIPGTFFFIYFL
jgi:hypothetical protein